MSVAADELAVVAESPNSREELREGVESEASAGREVVVGSFDTARVGGNAGRAEPIGVIPLELAVPPADPAGFVHQRWDAVSGGVIHRDVRSEVEIVSRFRSPGAELLVATRLEPVVEETDVLEHGATDRQTAGRREQLVLHEPLDVQVVEPVVLRDRPLVLGAEQFDVTGEERENLERDIIDAVENLDEEDGADYSDIAEEVDAPEDQLEDTINSLLSEGTFYEPKPGKIKKL